MRRRARDEEAEERLDWPRDVQAQEVVGAQQPAASRCIIAAASGAVDASVHVASSTSQSARPALAAWVTTVRPAVGEEYVPGREKRRAKKEGGGAPAAARGAREGGAASLARAWRFRPPRHRCRPG